MGSIREMMITIGDVIQEDLVLQKLRDAKTFGMMIDDVTDITNTEQCVCFVQYVSKDGMPKVQFLFIEDALKNSNFSCRSFSNGEIFLTSSSSSAAL
jgi:hypothetical protein